MLTHESRRLPSWLIFDVRQKTKSLLLLLSAFLAASAFGSDAAVPKNHLEVAGIRYVYLDHRSLWTGSDGIKHVIVAFADTADFEAINLVSRQGTAAPHLVAPESDVALPHVGVYLVTRSAKKLVVRIVDWGSPQSSEEKVVREYVEAALKRPNKAPEPTPGPVTPRANESESK